ncbi:hypothetical protein TraAM80_05577 [Trypanosoma rangeli]|uniref:Uncharacterized protein n=1 Tax=Trypanosoma rangeli TaxID=5698 RepID=A0A3R7NK16_TRYRA|nr:uncharacterized protein TraAM80_05577 [Trypanosoma rangeli]RNF03754.1 hypothetical protein TraAM80_05577 [Trypanosoma rangeli]|eukprot:RNF03754.1 hypothetical protein TraAM80_05577 [Trypanosoma rangeli]
MAVAVSADGDVVSFLRHAGECYAEHKELLRRKHLEDERRECPFRPTVSEYAEKMSRHSITRRSEAVEKRLHELHAKRLEVAQAQRAESREREWAEMAVEVRAPQVTARARSLVSRDPAEVSRKWLEKREEKFARLREEALRRDLEALREVPRISQYAQERFIAERHQGQAIEDYLMAKEEARRERMYWLAEEGVGTNSSFSNSSFFRLGKLPERQDEPQPAFTPRITEYTKQLHRSGNVEDRLLAGRGEDRKVPHDTSCTFAPRIAPASLEMSKNYYSDPNALVYDRLYRNDAMRLRELRRKRANVASQKESTGIPRISETSRLIVERKRAEAMEKELQHSPTTRLHPSLCEAYKYAQKKQPLLQARQKEEKERCTFRPRVNPTSEKMWRHQLQMLQEDGYARTAEGARELLWRRSQQRMEEEARRRRAMEEAQEMEECTFHPKVGRSPERRVGRELSLSQRNEMWQRQRDRRLREARMELERTQLSECSFHPTVDSVFPLPAHDATVVSGYEAHVLRQEESRRRKQETQEWWRPKTVSPKGPNASRQTFSSVSEPRRRHRQPRQGSEGMRQVSASSSQRSCSTSFSGRNRTQFVVNQAPSCASLVSPGSASPLSPRPYHQNLNHRRLHYSGDNGIGAAVQSVKPSPVEFIIRHHRAIVESSRRRG